MKTRDVFLLGIAMLLLSPASRAGVFELGGEFSYQHNTYNGGAYTWTRSYSATFGYYFTADSEVEFSYQDSMNEEYEPSVQDITYHDRVYSLNYLYHLFDETTPIRPFFRLGAGQLNRDETGWYQGGYSPAGTLDQLTVILGAGVQAKLTGRFALKAEATTYLSGALSTWRDNIIVSVGGSFYF